MLWGERWKHHERLKKKTGTDISALERLVVGTELVHIMVTSAEAPGLEYLFFFFSIST